MGTSKNQPVSSGKIIETLGLILVPLVIVLTAGILLRSMMTEPVAEARSLPAQNDDKQNSPADVSGVESIQENEVPNSSFASSYVNGITFQAGNYRLDDMGNLLVDFCFDQIDTGDWTIWSSHLTDAQGHEALLAGGDLLEVRFPPKLVDGKSKQQIIDFRSKTGSDVRDYSIDAPAGKKTGQRCVAATYGLPDGFDPSGFTATVDSIMAYPNESEQCSDAVRVKIQKVLDEKKTGIKTKLKEDKSNSGGMCGLEVIQKPGNISQQEAQSIATGSEMFLDVFGIRGPWVFEGSVR